jgi:hypothetical protein
LTIAVAERVKHLQRLFQGHAGRLEPAQPPGDDAEVGQQVGVAAVVAKTVGDLHGKPAEGLMVAIVGADLHAPEQRSRQGYGAGGELVGQRGALLGESEDVGLLAVKPADRAGPVGHCQGAGPVSGTTSPSRIGWLEEVARLPGGG